MSKIEEMLATLSKKDQETLKEVNAEFGVFEDGSLAVKVTCPRCWGSGHYSRCEMYGTRCFMCNVASGGKMIGYLWRSAKKEAARIRRAKKTAEKRAKEAEAKQAQWLKEKEEIERKQKEAAEKAEQAKLEKQNKQTFLGTVGEKIELTGTVRFSKYFPSQNYGWAGRTLNSFVTDDGSIFLHWATGNDTYTPGSRLLIKGTVKEHTIYDKTGDKQTVLTRAKYFDSDSNQTNP